MGPGMGCIAGAIVSRKRQRLTLTIFCQALVTNCNGQRAKKEGPLSDPGDLAIFGEVCYL